MKVVITRATRQTAPTKELNWDMNKFAEDVKLQAKNENTLQHLLDDATR